MNANPMTNFCKKVDLENRSERDRMIDQIDRIMRSKGIWEKVAEDPLFALPSRTTLPHDMVNLAIKHDARFVRVQKPHVPETSLSGLPHLERTIVNFFTSYEKGEITDRFKSYIKDNIRQILIEGGYSESTTECFLGQCSISFELASCIESCLDNTLSWTDKLKIYLYSNEINRAVGNLLEDKGLFHFIKRTVNDAEKWNGKALIESSIRTLFPTDHSNLFTRIRNFLVRQAVIPLQKESLTKYTPIALAYGPLNEAIANSFKQVRDQIQNAKAKIQRLGNIFR